MIEGVSKVSLEVEDQDRAKRFWTETMGFELVQDSPYQEGYRWLEVRSPDKGVTLVLSARGERPTVVDERLPTSNVFFYCDDLEQTYREMSDRGVKFPLAPEKTSFGWWSIFEDPDGNRFALTPRGQ